MITAENTAQRILDSALDLAERSSWEAVRLYDVALAAGMTLDDIRAHFREKEDLVEAWFDRADGAMLQDATRSGFRQLSTRERLQRLIMVWLDTLAVHRRVTRQMILAKCEPGHLHIQIPAVMRISRTVQWLREASHQDATYVRRALEETVLTSIYLTAFIHWMSDDSPESQRTRQLLDTSLGIAEKAANGISLAKALLRPRFFDTSTRPF